MREVIRDHWGLFAMGAGCLMLAIAAAIALGPTDVTTPTPVATQESEPTATPANADDQTEAQYYVVPAIARDVPGQAPPPPTPTPTPSPTPIPPTPTPSPAPGAGTIYVTFDDGPHPTWTPAILNTLAAHGARATFFVVGQQAVHYPRLLQSAVSAGHTIGNHSYTHRDLTQLSAGAVSHEIEQTQSAIANATGRTSTCFRPPYGRTNAVVANEVGARGMSMVMWGIDSGDWTQPAAQTMADHVVRNARNGSVVLMHDGGGNRAQTVAALDIILTQLRSQGYTFAALNC